MKSYSAYVDIISQDTIVFQRNVILNAVEWILSFLKWICDTKWINTYAPTNLYSAQENHLLHSASTGTGLLFIPEGAEIASCIRRTSWSYETGQNFLFYSFIQ